MLPCGRGSCRNDVQLFTLSRRKFTIGATHMLKNSIVSITAAMLLSCSAGLVQAQTPTPEEQAKAQTTTDRDPADERDFDWGLLGLIGLLGLAGLTGRGREVVTRRATTVRNEPL